MQRRKARHNVAQGRGPRHARFSRAGVGARKPWVGVLNIRAPEGRHSLILENVGSAHKPRCRPAGARLIFFLAQRLRAGLQHVAPSGTGSSSAAKADFLLSLPAGLTTPAREHRVCRGPRLKPCSTLPDRTVTSLAFHGRPSSQDPLIAGLPV